MLIILSIKTFSEQYIELFAVFTVALPSWSKHSSSCYRTYAWNMVSEFA